MDGVKLTPAEWNVMDCLWERSPQTAMELVRELEETVGWARSTTLTVLRRMEAKGLLRGGKAARGTAYVPLAERSGAAQAETRSFLDRVYRGSVGMMMNAIVRDGLSREELDQLREILDAAEREARS